LFQCTQERNVYRIAWQPVARYGETGHMIALQDFKTHTNSARKDKIRAGSISNPKRQNPWQSEVHKLKDENDQPDARDPQPQDQQALQ
jgi:hypothetical protein